MALSRCGSSRSRSGAAAAAPAAIAAATACERRVRFLEPMTAVMLANHRRVRAVRRRRRRAGRRRPQLGRARRRHARNFGATCEVAMGAGDVFVIETPGGGGFGGAGDAQEAQSRAARFRHPPPGASVRLTFALLGSRSNRTQGAVQRAERGDRPHLHHHGARRLARQADELRPRLLVADEVTGFLLPAMSRRWSRRSARCAFRCARRTAALRGIVWTHGVPPEGPRWGPQRSRRRP